MDKIGGYTFVWNDKQSTYKGKDIGVVAQEIQESIARDCSNSSNGYLVLSMKKLFHY